jgi:hypothetical protein
MCSRVRHEYREKVFHAQVPWTAALATAPDGRTPLGLQSGRPKVPAPFRLLAGEVIQRLPILRH